MLRRVARSSSRRPSAPARFGRLLTEPLTPPSIRAETAAALAEPGPSPGAASTGRQPLDSGRV